MNVKEWEEILMATGFADVFTAKNYNPNFIIDVGLSVQDIRNIRRVLRFAEKAGLPENLKYPHKEKSIKE